MLDLPLTRAAVPRLEVLAAAASTNTELVRRATEEPDSWAAGSLLVTDAQTAGRGRLGRSWSAPPGTSLAVSLLLKPRLPPERLAWLSLLAGAAMVRSLRDAGVAADLKWPNDVLIGQRKVCGVLAEVLPDGGVVIGAGLNHAVPADALPVPTATSLLVEGGPTDPDALVSGYVRAVHTLLAPFEAADGDPDAGGLRAAVEAVCGTLSRRVRVSLPDGSVLIGRATGIDASGRIVVRPEAPSEPVAVASGDVEHLRYE